MSNATLIGLLVLNELVNKDACSYESPNDTESSKKAKESAKRKHLAEPACCNIRDVLTDLEVKLIETVVSAGSRRHVVDDATIFKASALVLPSICGSLFIDLECNGDANTLDHIVPVAHTALE